MSGREKQAGYFIGGPQPALHTEEHCHILTQTTPFFFFFPNFPELGEIHASYHSDGFVEQACKSRQGYPACSWAAAAIPSSPDMRLGSKEMMDIKYAEGSEEQPLAPL